MGRSLRIYMLDGGAIGPKTVEIGNWSGKAIYTPRAYMKNILVRAEFNSSGIYLLRSESDSVEYGESVYIGETEYLRSRLKQHIAERDFESAICFLSKDELLTKGHVKYLESRLISLAHLANNSHVENITNPQLSRLSEADISDMEYFIDQIRLILPAVGLNTLVEAVPRTSGTALQVSSSEMYKVKSKTLSATMVEIDNAFVVMAGSEASFTANKSMSTGWSKLRKKLLDAGILKSDGKRLLFKEDAIFSSPSAAASVILGRQAPGPLVWISVTGESYKDVQEKLPKE
jgi:hypothetical protein